MTQRLTEPEKRSTGRERRGAGSFITGAGGRSRRVIEQHKTLARGPRVNVSNRPPPAGTQPRSVEGHAALYYPTEPHPNFSTARGNDQRATRARPRWPWSLSARATPWSSAPWYCQAIFLRAVQTLSTAGWLRSYQASSYRPLLLLLKKRRMDTHAVDGQHEARQRR